MAGKFEVATIFKAIDKMSAPVRKMTTQLDLMLRGTQRQMRELGRTTDATMAGIKKAGATAVVAGGLIAGGLWQSSQAGISFEQTLANVSAKMGSTAYRGTANFAMMEDAAKRVGAQTEFSTTQAADALNFMAMAGFNVEQAVAAMPGVIDLATASQTDLATATDIATDTLGAFNLMSKDSAQLQQNLSRVNDVLAKTTVTSNTNMQQLFETMKKGGPVATVAGASIETVAAMAGTMANAGIKAEIAGTAVANSFLNLSKPSTQAAQVLRRLGVRTQDANGKLRDMPDIIDDLNRGMGKLTQTQRQAATEVIFGREGLAGNIAVLQAGGDALRQYRAQLEQSTGASAEMARISRDTTQGSINSLKSAIEGVSIAMFAQNRGPMRDAIDLATQWVRKNGDMIAQNVGGFFLKVAENLDKIIEVGKGLAIVVATIWGVNTALKAVAAAQVLWNAAAWKNPYIIGAMAVYEGRPGGMLSASSLFGENSVTNFLDKPLADFFSSSDTNGVSSPQERVATQINENTERSINEVIIRDETQRAQVRNIQGPQRLTVQQTGGFN